MVTALLLLRFLFGRVLVFGTPNVSVFRWSNLLVTNCSFGVMLPSLRRRFLALVMTNRGSPFWSVSGLRLTFRPTASGGDLPLTWRFRFSWTFYCDCKLLFLPFPIHFRRLVFLARFRSIQLLEI